MELKEVKHHQPQELCKTRAVYRQGKKLTAVKVYTVSAESQHLFIYGVPKINLRPELKSLCSKYGQLRNLHVIEDHKTEIFTECYHVQYERIQSARVAKRNLDNRSFYGSLLHVCYAPEHESVAETRAKLAQRRVDVLRRLGNEDEPAKETYREPERKRKRPALALTDERMAELDPMLVWKDAPKEIDPRVRKKIKSDEYGPYFNRADLIRNKIENKQLIDAGRKLIPSQVVKAAAVEKRIVFSNRRKLI